MSKPKFDLDLFWSLPRGEKKLLRDGKYCAIGAGLKALGYSDDYICSQSFNGGNDFVDLVGAGEARKIYCLNDEGYYWKNGRITFPDGRVEDPTTASKAPNHEAAKRLLVESIKDKVEFVSKEVVFAEDKELANV